MRFPSLLLVAAAASALAAACGPTVILEDALGGDTTSGGEGAAGPSGGHGAAGPTSGNGAAGPTSGNGAAGPSGGNGAAGPSGGSGAGSSGGTGSDQWAKAFGADGHQHLRALVTNAAGDVIVAGFFDGALDFGAGPLAQGGLRSGFVAKLDPVGHAIWSVPLTADDCAADALSLDAAGDVLVTGYVKGSLHVGKKLIPGGDGVFVAKLDAGGQLAWAKTFGSSAGMQQPDRGLAIAAASGGGALVSGSFAGAIDFGGGALPSSGGVFVAALDAGGGHVWSKALPGSAGFVAAGAAGQAIVATNGDGGAMTALDLDAAGNVLWSHGYSPGSFDAVAADAAGNVYLAGSTTTADFGGGPVPSPLPNGEAFVVSLDAKGNHRFTRGLPFDDFQSTAVALALDPAGFAAVTGSYIHHVDSSTSIQSAFLVLVDPSGKMAKSRTFGPTDGLGAKVTQEGWGVAPAPKAGSFYVGGDFYTAIDVAGVSLTGGGTSDVFVAKVTP